MGPRIETVACYQMGPRIETVACYQMDRRIETDACYTLGQRLEIDSLHSTPIYPNNFLEADLNILVFQTLFVS
jgi:hypothetical protein